MSSRRELSNTSWNDRVDFSRKFTNKIQRISGPRMMPTTLKIRARRGGGRVNRQLRSLNSNIGVKLVRSNGVSKVCFLSGQWQNKRTASENAYLSMLTITPVKIISAASNFHRQEAKHVLTSRANNLLFQLSYGKKCKTSELSISSFCYRRKTKPCDQKIRGA